MWTTTSSGKGKWPNKRYMLQTTYFTCTVSFFFYLILFSHYVYVLQVFFYYNLVLGFFSVSFRFSSFLSFLFFYFNSRNLDLLTHLPIQLKQKKYCLRTWLAWRRSCLFMLLLALKLLWMNGRISFFTNYASKQLWTPIL